MDAYKQWRQWADEKVCCDYSLHMAITYWNDSVAEQMKSICSEEIGINSFKCFMAYKDVMMLQDDEIIEVFKVRIVKYTMYILCVCHIAQSQALEDVILMF